jgi:signal transduction histidine kinase/DNA-binding response OmpR family regulator
MNPVMNASFLTTFEKSLDGYIPWKYRRFLVAMGLAVIAASLRIWPLESLGSRLVWLTFYPAVMLAAIYGGFAAGILTAGLACFTALYLGPFLVEKPFIVDSADYLGMAVFIITSTMICVVAELMRRATARAKKAKEEAEAANRAKSVFLSTMSHELRTPLNAILGFSYLMSHDVTLSEENRKILNIINHSGNNLLNLINDVLDMAKIEAGNITIENLPFDLDELLVDVVDLMKGRAEEKGLDLRLDRPADFPRFFRGDFVKIRQILMNLVGNAIKFTPRGEVVLRLIVRPTDDPVRSMVVIEVQDSGVGISPEDQGRVFEPFVQVGNQSFQKGSGLGLAITRRFTELMGGRISVTSVPDQGSTFSLEIPLDQAKESDITDLGDKVGRVVGLVPGQPEYRILIVEDQMENWLLLQRILGEVGLTTRVANNGIEGVVSYQEWKPHIILMDIRMPLMDGLEATRRIRKLEGGDEVKIVAVTASVFGEERDRVMAAGMDDFLRKPYRPEEIFAILTKDLSIRFVVEEPSRDSDSNEESVLSHDDLAGLPREIQEELAEALVSMDMERMTTIIGEITVMDPKLGHTLAFHAGNLEYTAMLQSLRGNDLTVNGEAP